MSAQNFVLHADIASGKYDVTCLKLCKVLLNDDRTWPWLVLIPMRANAVEIHDLIEEDQSQLMREISACSKALSSCWNPSKINIGALGCVCRQLHVHVLCRFEGDAAWPRPVWGATLAVPYENSEVEGVIARLRAEISKFI